MAKPPKTPISQFAGLKQMRSTPAPINPVESPVEQALVSIPSEVKEPNGTRRIGRPPGKRSNPDMEQTTVYINRDLKEEAQKILKRHQKERRERQRFPIRPDLRDFSELVNDLLMNYVALNRKD